jgi:hypothetical protein
MVELTSVILTQSIPITVRCEIAYDVQEATADKSWPDYQVISELMDKVVLAVNVKSQGTTVLLRPMSTGHKSW